MHATRIWGVATKPEQSSQSCASLPRGRAEHRALARSSASRPVSVGVRLAASERYDPELCRRDLCCWCRRLFAADGRGRGEFLSAQGTPECESIIIYRQGETPHRPRRARQSYFVMPGWRETCWVQRTLSAVSSSPTGWRVSFCHCTRPREGSLVDASACAVLRARQEPVRSHGVRKETDDTVR